MYYDFVYDLPLSYSASLSKLWWYLLLRLLGQFHAAGLELQAGPCLWLLPCDAARKSFLLKFNRLASSLGHSIYDIQLLSFCTCVFAYSLFFCDHIKWSYDDWVHFHCCTGTVGVGLIIGPTHNIDCWVIRPLHWLGCRAREVMFS